MAVSLRYRIVERIAERYQISVETLMNPRWQRERHARHSAMIVIRDMTNLSYAEIADWFDLHHASVMTAVKNKRLARLADDEMADFDPSEIPGEDEPPATESRELADAVAGVADALTVLAAAINNLAGCKTGTPPVDAVREMIGGIANRPPPGKADRDAG